MPSPRPCSPAAERNGPPILDVLRRLLPARARVLEIASGTGQHAAFFAAAMPGWQWQPSDGDAQSLGSIDAWRADAANVLPPVVLDVMATDWPVRGPFDAVFCANMLHISPWATCAALMRGSAQVLAPGGLLVTYGPYLQDGVETAPGNIDFDASLRARNPAWGIRRVEDVAQEAAAVGLRLLERTPMPANNLILAFAHASIPQGR
jgi:SAM-dependent methyltransferase